jgi:hypothetical protein
MAAAGTFVLGSSILGGPDVLGGTKTDVPAPVGGGSAAPVVSSFALTAPYFLIDLAAVMPSRFIPAGPPFVLGSSTLGGGDVLGDPASAVPNPFVLGSSTLGGSDVLGVTAAVPDTETDVLGRIVSIYDFFPPYPRVSIVQAGLTISPTTNRLQAITGQAEAQLAGSQVQFNLITQAGVEFSVAAIYNGRRSVFVG